MTIAIIIGVALVLLAVAALFFIITRSLKSSGQQTVAQQQVFTSITEVLAKIGEKQTQYGESMTATIAAQSESTKNLSGLVASMNSVIQENSNQVSGAFQNLQSSMVESMQKMTDGITSVVQKQTSLLTDNLQSQTGNVNARLDGAATVIGKVNNQLGELQSVAQTMQSAAVLMESLESILKNSKLRGNWGEMQLESLLANILPRAAYEMQYRLDPAVVVDAVIKMGASALVPVDAKFPLDAYRRVLAATDQPTREKEQKEFHKAVKARIDEIKKYIAPDKGTLEFALMFVPAEGVYSDLIASDSLMEYARSVRVIPVSPNTLFTMLQVIVMGLRGFQISENAQAILAGVARMQGDLTQLNEKLELAGKHFANGTGALNNAQTLLSSSQNRVAQLVDGQDNGEHLQIAA